MHPAQRSDSAAAPAAAAPVRTVSLRKLFATETHVPRSAAATPMYAAENVHSLASAAAPLCTCRARTGQPGGLWETELRLSGSEGLGNASVRELQL
eukprot:jgi/Ulvmu1/2332/UM013_0180.1